MPDLLRLETADWSLLVWSKDISAASARLQETLARREKEMPMASFRFNPPLTDIEYAFGGHLAVSLTGAQSGLSMPAPLFFENRQYEFEFIFRNIDDAVTPAVQHRLRTVEDSFHYRQQHHSLIGTINTGNDIGWFRLAIAYGKAGRKVEQSLSFEVLPLKMDMAGDIGHILEAVDAEYPLWRFAFAQKTDYELARSKKPHERFPLLWLAHFESLQQDLQKGIRLIMNAPHTRLVPVEKFRRADRLKGRLSYRLEEKIEVHRQQGEYHHRYADKARLLTVDTPENRFIKMVLVSCIRELGRIKAAAYRNDLAPDQQPLSTSFYEKLEGWKLPLEQLLRRSMFDEVGDFTGMSRESLVLHQKAGYANVYRIWQQLKMYLDVFGNNATTSMKTVAELYEVWCLLEIRQILRDLGFNENLKAGARLKTDYLEKKLVDGIGASFRFERNGIQIRLAHEPVFSKNSSMNAGIHSWTTTQKPDIYLEAEFPDGQTIRWIFDAKYRIANGQTEDGGQLPDDYAPDDAINQMHRYRDALIHHARTEDGRYVKKSRPVLGAYVLYPGWFDQEDSENPYAEEIAQVGIGAFALLPGQQNKWLRDFLAEKLGKQTEDHTYSQQVSDIHYAEDAARIAYHGMTIRHFDDLTLVATAAPKDGRSAEYLQAFEDGSAGWYHMRLEASERENIRQAIMREIRFCAIAVLNETQSWREIHYVYPVRSVQLQKRQDIPVEKTGKTPAADMQDGDYWLFELGKAVRLGRPVIKNGIDDHHYMKLTDVSELENQIGWDELPARYSSVFT